MKTPLLKRQGGRATSRRDWRSGIAHEEPASGGTGREREGPALAAATAGGAKSAGVAKATRSAARPALHVTCFEALLGPLGGILEGGATHHETQPADGGGAWFHAPPWPGAAFRTEAESGPRRSSQVAGQTEEASPHAGE